MFLQHFCCDSQFLNESERMLLMGFLNTNSYALYIYRYCEENTQDHLEIEIINMHIHT